MKQRIICWAMIFCMAIVSVSAWHCTTTDDGAQGWYAQYYSVAPTGCVNTYDGWMGLCSDQCLSGSTTYRDFSCAKRFPNNKYNTESVIAWKDTLMSDNCKPSQEVPEFTTISSIIALTGIGLYLKKKRN